MNDLDERTSLSAHIVAVTVYPDRARITRRGTIELAAGEHRVVLDGLPLALDPHSVRVSGSGSATVLGVDVQRRHAAQTSEDALVRLEADLRDARARLAALDDDDAILAEQRDFYRRLARRASRSYADAFAAGQAETGRATDLAESVAGRLSGLHRDRRALAVRREEAAADVAAAQRRLDARLHGQSPDQMSVVISVAVHSPTDGTDDSAVLTLEVSYVVGGAGWTSAYDLRLAGETLTLTWFGVVTQRTGEDWPECELRLSTARPAATTAVPDLDPWFLDRWTPVPPPSPKLMRAAFDMPSPSVAGPGEMLRSREAIQDATFQPLAEAVAAVEQGAVAATYTPARPVAVPADGGAHRARLAQLELGAVRDYVTAPVISDAVYVRATVVNTSTHTLPAARASVFHEGDFVGTTSLAVWAPGEEVELALGIDDRIRVERELVRRTSTKAVLGATRRRDAEHRLVVTNHTGTAIKVSVIDQLPVSKDEGIVVKELRLEPAPTERTDLGEVKWVLALDSGARAEIHIGVRVELARGVEMIGWRE